MPDAMTAITNPKIMNRPRLLGLMTPTERRFGRFMRAPDHDAGTAPPPAAAAAPGDGVVPPAAAEPPAGAGDETLLGGGAEQKPEGGDPKSPDEGGEAEAPALTGAPEKYEFTLPEGVALDEEALGVFEPVLREMDLNQEAAAKIVGVYAEKVLPLLAARADQQATTAGEELRADWSRATMADKEIGGAKIEEAKAMAARAMAKFLPQGEDGQRFRTFLNESGLGNHPEMVRMLSRIGRDLGEASVNQGTTAKEALTSAEKFYGKNYGKQG